MPILCTVLPEYYFPWIEMLLTIVHSTQMGCHLGGQRYCGSFLQVGKISIHHLTFLLTRQDLVPIITDETRQWIKTSL